MKKKLAALMLVMVMIISIGIPVEAKTVNRYYYKVTAKEFDMLCRVVEAEVGNSSEKSKMYSVYVILNRVSRKDFPNTIKGVVFQKHQYSTTLPGHRYWTVKVSENTKTAVRKALMSKNPMPKNVIFADNKKHGVGVWKKVDGTYYCYSKYDENGKRVSVK